MSWILPTFDPAAALQSSPQHRFRNGNPRRSEPLELTAFFKTPISNATAVESMRELLEDVAQNTPLDPSLLRIVSRSSPSGQQTSVRISWGSLGWWQSLDLVAGLEFVRNALNDHGQHEVHWSNASTDDKRSCAELTFEPPPGLSLDHRCAQELCTGAGVQLAETPKRQGRTGTLSIRCFRPSDVDKLSSVITAHPEFESRSVQIAAPTDCINVPYPTCIASPERSHREIPYLLEELDEWVAEFNAKHESSEALLSLENGDRVQHVHGSCVVAVPSSMALAQYLIDRLPYYGNVWEFCYSLNERKLVPREVDQKKEHQHLQNSVNNLRADVRRLNDALRRMWSGTFALSMLG